MLRALLWMAVLPALDAATERSADRAHGEQEVVVSLRGEPKSGTTWLEVVLVKAVEVGCRANATTGCRLLSPWDQSRRQFVIEVQAPAGWGYNPPGGRQRVRFSMAEKHQLPLLARTCDLAKRKQGLAWRSPHCPRAGDAGAGRATPAPGARVLASHDGNWIGTLVGAELESCLAGCRPERLRPGPGAPRVRYLHIQRDPRDLVISDCFWTTNRGKGWDRTPPPPEQLADCALARLVVLAPWVKLREIWFRYLTEELGVPVTQICYEDMHGSVDGYRRVVESVGIALSDAELQVVMAATTVTALRGSVNNVPTGGHGQRDLDDKLRAGPRVRFTDYGMHPEVIALMGDIMRGLAFNWFLPSGAAKGAWAVATGGGAEGLPRTTKLPDGKVVGHVSQGFHATQSDFMGKLRQMSPFQLWLPAMVVVAMVVGCAKELQYAMANVPTKPHSMVPRPPVATAAASGS